MVNSKRRPWSEKKAQIALGLVDVARGMFTPDQAAQIEQWRAENEAKVKEAAR